MNDSHANNLKFYRGKRVLITGHTGFKGSWLTSILFYMGANVLGYSLEPENGSLYDQIKGDELLKNVTGDLLDYLLLEQTIQEFQPEIVIHLAAFGFIKECYEDPVRAYNTNLIGSVNLLEAVKKCQSIKSVVLVSTDKVYANKGNGAIYAEDDMIGGEDPYSSSKTCMEFMSRNYRSSYLQTENVSVGIATVRASNVLGGGDHIQTRLIPSILTSVANGTNVELRNPNQTRPWQSVLDALDGYLTVARYLYENPLTYSGAWNIGPTKDGICTVSWVFERIQETFTGLEGKKGERFQVNEAETLGLSIQKSLSMLDWKPSMSCDKVIDQVVEFFKCQRAGQWERQICFKQISDFYGKK